MESKSRHVRAFSSSGFCNNGICTTNYRWYNFVPLNLYKQFHRVANWFFVTMIALNWVPQLNAVGKYFSITPLLVVLSSDAIKDLYEDIRRGRQDDQINERDAHCYNKKKQRYYQKKWKDIQVGDVIKILCKEEVPADILLIDTSDEFGFAYADTSTLDGETNLKQRTLVKIPDYESTGIRNLELDVKVDMPNNDLTKLNGYIENAEQNISLNLDNFLLRGSELRNTDYIVGLVVYTGHDTKAMQNNKGSRTKMSKIERMMNSTVLMIFMVLLLICFISAIGQWLWLNAYSHEQPQNITLGPDADRFYEIQYKVAPYLPYTEKNLGYLAFLSFFTYAIIFNQLIPMSLYILLEITKLIQIWFIQQDLDLCGKSTILCRAMSIAEDLGQVQYVFSDKTGTLTENKMIFKCLSVSKKLYGCTETGKQCNVTLDDGTVKPIVDQAFADALQSEEKEYEECKKMIIAMTLCNTVMVTTEGRRGTSFSQYLPKDFNRIVYEAESPDELAFVNAAREYGSILLRRTPESCVVRHQKTIMRYKVLCTLPFDSHRKCMSIIVIHPRTMRMIMYTKGADSAIYKRLRSSTSKEEEELRSVTLDHINSFAKKGLRTLTIAYKNLEQPEYQHFIMKFRQASLKLDGRAEAISKVCSTIENNLTLIGATGVEDKLQEGVPEVLSSLRAAGIVVWVLTGDKQETAVSIGYSSQMYSRDTNLLYIRTNDMQETRQALCELMDHTPTGQIHKQALIISGCSIEFLLSRELRADFIALCQTCQTVICCRVTPLQKSVIVSTIREELQVMTLAVGDGANDVGMLRQADIGVGIAGREGTQAVMASDFAIEKFRMLQTLILVHGHWTYNRISDFIFYFFYKNLFYATLTFFYQFFNGFSGSFPNEEFIVVTFNTFWTTPGTLVAFALNQYSGSKDEILANPKCYASGRRSEFFNTKNLIIHMMEAIYHGVLVFSIHSISCWDTITGKLEFGGGLTFIALFVMNVAFLVRSPNITLVLVGTVVFTLVAGNLYLYLYGMLNFLWKFFNEDPHYTYAHALHAPITWVNLLIVTILAFLPRLLVQVLVNYQTASDKKTPAVHSLRTCWYQSKKIFTKETKFAPVVNSSHLESGSVEFPTISSMAKPDI